jgi:hypothetical protein
MLRFNACSVRLTLSVIAVGVFATVASAQSTITSWDRPSLTVALIGSSELEGVNSGSPHELRPLGGDTVGVAVSVLHQLDPHVGIDLGFRLRGPITGVNSIALYDDSTWAESHREIAFDAMLTFMKQAGNRVRFEPGGGVALIRGTTDHSNVLSRSYDTKLSAYVTRPLPDQEFVDWWMGFGFGLDAAFATTRRTALVSSVRGYWMPTRNAYNSLAVNLSNSVFDIGFGLRLTF